MNLRRKRYVLMNSGVWKGHTRSISGNPVTFDNALGLRTLEVLGNSVQDGTPSPDNPVEVVGVGERILPEEYNQLEYIEGTGTQWINTDFLADQNSGMYLKAQLIEIEENSPNNGRRMFAGSVNSNFGIGYNSANGLYRFIFTRRQGSGTDTNNIPFPDTLDINIHEFKNNFLDDSKFWLDTMARDAPEWVFSNDYGIAIFRTTYEAANNYYNEPIKARIYSFKFSQGNEVVADLIPAQRISDNKVGMYDIINNTFYSSAGTEEFLAGNNIEIYKVPVSVEGRNLFDAEGIVNSTDDTSLKMTTYQNKNCLSWVDGGPAENQRNMQGYFKENTQYTFSFTGYSEKTISIDIWYTDGTYLHFAIACNGAWNHQIKTSAYGKTIDYWRGGHSYGKRVYIDLAQSQIVEGSYTAETMPPYEPYKEPQTLNIYTPQILHGLGGVSDTIVLDFDNRKAELVQNVSFSKFTGNEDWYTVTQTTDIQKYYLATNIVKPNNIGVRYTLSNIAVYSGQLNQKNQVTAYGFKTNNGWVGYSVDINEYPTIESFKMHLQEMNNSNTPVKIYVDCKNTPVITDITTLQDWDNMPDISGTIILTADSTAEPNLNVSYYSTTKE